jgi:hypothetical protein
MRRRRFQGYQLAQTVTDSSYLILMLSKESDEQPEINYVSPSLIRPSLNDDVYTVPPELIGISPKVLKSFPTMLWQDDSNGTTKKPENNNINNNNLTKSDSFMEEYSEYMYGNII